MKDERLEEIYLEVDSDNIGKDVGMASPRIIEDKEQATRYAYGLSETRNQIQEIENIAASEIAIWQAKIDKVKQWQEEVTRPLQDKADYLAAMLSDYHRREFESAPNEKAQASLKSIKLPYGVVLASRVQQPELQVTNDEAYKAYAKDAGLLDVIEKPKWAEIKKQLTVLDNGTVVDSNGQVVEFITAVPQPRKFEVK